MKMKVLGLAAVLALSTTMAMAQSNSAGGNSEAGGPAASKTTTGDSMNGGTTAGGGAGDEERRDRSRSQRLSAVIQGREHPGCQHSRRSGKEGRCYISWRNYEEIATNEPCIAGPFCVRCAW